MLYKVFDFAEKEVADVMVPRPDVVGIAIDLAPEEAMAAMLEAPYTRYPVYRETLDEIVGILHVRDLVASLHNGGGDAVALAELLRPPVRRARDQGPRRPARGLPADEPAHGRRRGRVRRDRGHRHARGPARGDRRRHRGRVRPPERVRRARERDDGQDRRVVHDRRLQRGVRDRARHARTSTRSPGSSSATSAARRRSATRSRGRAAPLPRARDERLADPAPRGRVPARRRSGRTTRRKPPDRRKSATRSRRAFARFV